MPRLPFWHGHKFWILPIECWWEGNRRIDIFGKQLYARAIESWERQSSMPKCSATGKGAGWVGFERTHANLMWQRQLITTSNGFVGIGPVDAHYGDIVSVLLGCEVPVILPPAQDYFKLVGECYVDGLMYGEAILGLNAGKVHLQELCIN
jgi:hypothetical protein